MKLRTSALVAAVALAGLAGGAAAAPKVGCNIIMDAAGDDTVVATPTDPSVDLISGDVASDAKTLTAVIRVTKLANPNPRAPFGQSYFMVFSVKGSPDPLYVSAGVYPTGNEFLFGYQAVDPTNGINTSYKLGEGTGVVDLDKSELRVHVPLAAFASRAKLPKGAKLSGLTAEGRVLFGQRLVPSQAVGPSPRIPLGGVTLTADTAEGKTYLLGAPSCVAVGK